MVMYLIDGGILVFSWWQMLLLILLLLGCCDDDSDCDGYCYSDSNGYSDCVQLVFIVRGEPVKMRFISQTFSIE